MQIVQIVQIVHLNSFSFFCYSSLLLKDHFLTSDSASKHLKLQIGQLKISELRKRAETQLKDNFDIKDFHEVKVWDF